MKFVQTTIGKKQVKFKLGLVSDRLRMSSLEGPILSFAKLIGLPKVKDPSKISNPNELIDQLIELTYFSKEILPIHGTMTSNEEIVSNHYQQSNEKLIVEAFQSCQKKYQQINSSFHYVYLPQTCRHLTNLIRMFSFPSNGHLLLRTNCKGFGREELVQFLCYLCRLQYFNGHSSNATMDEDQSIRQSLRSSSLLAGLKQKNCVLLIRECLLSNLMIEQLTIFTREGTFPGLFSNQELIRIAAALSPGLPTNRRVNKSNAVLKTFYARIKKRLHLVILENSQCQKFFRIDLFIDQFHLFRSSTFGIVFVMFCR